MSEKFRKLDSDRLVHYEGVYNDRRYNGSSDMESQMYPPVERIVKNLAEQKEKPFICCEYTHAMGNSIGGMHKQRHLLCKGARRVAEDAGSKIQLSEHQHIVYRRWFYGKK